YQKEGVIDVFYPIIFFISVKEEKRPVQRLSFSYSDVLTKSVKLALVDEVEGAFSY
ncbi:MAG: Veg family protein, partial [Eubacterium sp.]